MKVREMIEWLKTVEDQDADVLIVSHAGGTGYYDQGGNAMEAEFDPVLHTEYVDMWKPIVTAPKDGSFVLICDTEDPSELMIIARWRFGAWRSRPTPSGKSIVWMDATHWMPLPEMPNE